jgi:arylsulfatase A-like enzyme
MLPTFAEIAGTTAPAEIDGISIVNALRGEPLAKQHEYLYWDYGHCRRRYDSAVRLGKWKGIRHGQQGDIQLYDLSSDIGEANDVARAHADIVDRIGHIMATAVTPSDRYPIGTLYTGGPIWKVGSGSATP